MPLDSELKRPHGIIIITIWFVIEGIYSFYQNSFGIFGGQNIHDLFVDSLLENTLIAYHLGFGFFYFVMAWGFWDAKLWIRIPTIIVLSATTVVTWILFSIHLISAFESILDTVLMGIVIVYLMKSNVKKYFQKQPMEPNPMKTVYKIIIGVSIPAALFGIFVLLIALNVTHMHENSERWMIELEPHLDLSADQLESQLRNENLKDLTLYRTETLEDYFESFNPSWKKQFKEAFTTEYRFVVYVDENHGYSKQQVQEIFTDINGIKESRDLHDWLLGRD